MPASIASSPTLLDHPTLDDLSTQNRDGRFFDPIQHRDLSVSPTSDTSPPPYPEPYIFSDDGDTSSFRLSGFSSDFDADGQLTPRLGSPTVEDPRARVSSSMQRPTAGLQLLYTHIAHGAIHDAVVERFVAPTCHPETHRAIVDDVMSWIQYMPPGSADAPPPTPSSPSTSKPPVYVSATRSFYGPHTRSNGKRSRTASMSPPPTQPEHICWLTGPTSCGKSSLMQTIAERCSNTFTRSHITLVPPNSMYNHVVCDPPVPLLAASFFFRHNREQRNNKSRFIPTLAWQLARNVPGLGDIMGRVIERDIGLLSLGEDSRGSGLEKPNGLARQMEKLILEPLAQFVQQVPSSQRHRPIAHRVVLVEAVDECINDEDQIEVLNVLRKLSQDGRFVPYFRLVVSSKPHRTIERQFKLHPDLDMVTYRLLLPFAEGSAVKSRSGATRRGRARAHRAREAAAAGAGFMGAGEFATGDGEALKSEDPDIDIRIYLQSKFNEICRKWYGLPRNVGWPDGDDPKDARDGVVDRLVYNAAGNLAYALTVIRFIMRGEGPERGGDASDPRRLLHLVLHAKFTKSYQQPYAALDALFNVIINDAAEKSLYSDPAQLAKAIREIDELLTTSGVGVELTLPRLALFFGFDADAEGEGRCLERAVTGGFLNPILDVPFPEPQYEDDVSFNLAGRFRPHFKGTLTLTRVVRFHHKSFTDFIRDPARAKSLYVSRSQLYTDLAVRYLRSASATYSLQPEGGLSKPESSSATLPNHGGKKGLGSPASSSSSFSATYNELGELKHQELPVSAPSTITSFRHLTDDQAYAVLQNRRRQSLCRHTAPSPYAIDPDDAAHFLSELHLGKFCSFSVADAPRLVKELMAFDVELWLFGITAAMEGRAERTHVLDLGSTGTFTPRGGGGHARPGYHRRVMSELPTANNRSNDIGAVPLQSGAVLREREREKQKKRSEALHKLHGAPSPSGSGGDSRSSSSAGLPESDVEAMYRWVHVECSWSSCTPVCRKWRRAIVKFWQRQGAPQQPTVMDRIYDKFMPRDVKRVQLITSRYRL